MPLKTKVSNCWAKDVPCTPKAPLVASTTPVSSFYRTPKPSRLSTLEAAVEPSEIYPLPGGLGGVSSGATECFWFSGSSPQRPPGCWFSGFSP